VHLNPKDPASPHGYHHTATPPKAIKTSAATMRAKVSRL